MAGPGRSAIVASALAGLWAVSPATHAAIVSMTETQTQTFREFGRGEFSVSMFDPLLGELQSITLSASGSGFDYNVESYRNISGATQVGEVTLTPKVQISGYVTSNDGLTRAYSLASFQAPYEVTPGYNFHYQGTAPAYSFSTTSTDAYALAAYTGYGSKTLLTSTSVAVGWFSSGDHFQGLKIGATSSGTITASITYTYDDGKPVPEPAGAATLALTAAALLPRRRRRGRAG